MALLIFLKQPNTAIAAEGDSKLLKESNLKGSFIQVRTLEGDSMFIATDNIAYVQEISKEKLIKKKKDFAEKQKQQQQQKSNLVIPNMSIPKHRN